MEGLPVGTVDIVIALVLLVSGLLAFARGLVREVLSVIGWVGAALVALHGFPYLRPHMRKLIGAEVIADIATGALLFIGTLVLLTLLSHAISRGVRDSAIGGLDRALGFVFGLLRGAALVCLVYIGALWFWSAEQLPRAVTEAKAMPLVREGAEVLLTLVPEETRRKTKAATGAARDRANEALEKERALRGLIQPQPRSDESQETGNKPAYSESERREMQRLIESKQ